MFPVLKSFIALYSSILFLMMGASLLNSYLSFRLSIEGVSTQVTGVILTAYYIGLVVGAFYCKRMIRSVGHIRAFAAFAAATTIVVMIHGLYVSPPLWAGLRFVTGISNMGLFMVIESWLNECAEPKVRGRVFSIYMIMAYLGGALGQKLLIAGNVETQTMYLVVGICLALSIIPVSVTHSIHPQLPRAEKIKLKTIFKKAPIGLIGCFAAGMMTSAFYTMGPVFTHQIHLTVSQMSWFMTLTVMGGLLLQWPVGTFSDRFDRSLVLPVLGFIVSVTCIVMVFSAQSSIGILLGTTWLFGGFVFTLYPVAVARAHDLFDVEDVVKVSSALLLAYGVGSSLGPMAVSAVMTLSGSPYGFYFYFMGISSLYSVITLLLRQKESVQILPAEEQSDFVMMKKTSSVAFHMDPRQDEDPSEDQGEDQGQSKDEEN
ncbi:MAG: MFS transporter [Desulfobacula sp.]|nr:MFS transporter [Desulfobacula sp.]